MLYQPTVPDGKAAEAAFLSQGQREYPELELERASRSLDLQFATDFTAVVNGRRIGVGLTLRRDWRKMAADVSKASAVWRHYVLVILYQDNPLARDNALAGIAELRLPGYIVIHATERGVRYEDARIYGTTPARQIRVG